MVKGILSVERLMFFIQCILLPKKPQLFFLGLSILAPAQRLMMIQNHIISHHIIITHLINGITKIHVVEGHRKLLIKPACPFKNLFL